VFTFFIAHHLHMPLMSSTFLATALLCIVTYCAECDTYPNGSCSDAIDSDVSGGGGGGALNLLQTRFVVQSDRVAEQSKTTDVCQDRGGIKPLDSMGNCVCADYSWFAATSKFECRDGTKKEKDYCLDHGGIKPTDKYGNCLCADYSWFDAKSDFECRDGTKKKRDYCLDHGGIKPTDQYGNCVCADYSWFDDKSDFECRDGTKKNKVALLQTKLVAK